MTDPISKIDELIDELGLRVDEEPTPPMPVRRYRSLCDARWKKISASLRNDPDGKPSIYLKLPSSKLWEIVLEMTYYDHSLSYQGEDQAHLAALQDFFRQEYKASMAPSIFLRIPVEEIKKDILSLKAVADFSSRSTSVEDFIAAVEAGLRNDPDVDWIARCGGPADSVSNNADSTPQVEDVEILGLPE